jgi:uncharacterized protein YukE
LKQAEQTDEQTDRLEQGWDEQAGAEQNWAGTGRNEFQAELNRFQANFRRRAGTG